MWLPAREAEQSTTCRLQIAVDRGWNTVTDTRSMKQRPGRYIIIKCRLKYYLEWCWFLRTLPNFTKVIVVCSEFDSNKPEFKSLAVRKSCFLFIHSYQIFQKLKSASNNGNLNKKVACCSEQVCDSELCMLDCKIIFFYISIYLMRRSSWIFTPFF